MKGHARDAPTLQTIAEEKCANDKTFFLTPGGLAWPCLRFSPVWNQSLTYTLFTLFPVLLFALVTLWKLKMSYDTDILDLQRSLDQVSKGFNQSAGLNMVMEKNLREKEAVVKMLEEKNGLLVNKSEILKASMKKVEERALNLTSRLLMKEMDMGMMKKEKMRLEEQLKKFVKEPADKEASSSGAEVSPQGKQPKFTLKGFNLEDGKVILSQDVEQEPKQQPQQQDHVQGQLKNLLKEKKEKKTSSQEAEVPQEQSQPKFTLKGFNLQDGKVILSQDVENGVKPQPQPVEAKEPTVKETASLAAADIPQEQPQPKFTLKGFNIEEGKVILSQDVENGPQPKKAELKTQTASNSTQQASGKAELVDKLIDIKKKQKELDDAKDNFFEDTGMEESAESGKSGNNVPLWGIELESPEEKDSIGQISQNANPPEVEVPSKATPSVRNNTIQATDGMNQEIHIFLDVNKTLSETEQANKEHQANIEHVDQNEIHNLIRLPELKEESKTPLPSNSTTEPQSGTKEEEKNIRIVLDVKNQNQ